MPMARMPERRRFVIPATPHPEAPAEVHTIVSIAPTQNMGF
jgi:hypothetical protein